MHERLVQVAGGPGRIANDSSGTVLEEITPAKGTHGVTPPLCLLPGVAEILRTDEATPTGHYGFQSFSQTLMLYCPVMFTTSDPSAFIMQRCDCSTPRQVKAILLPSGDHVG